MRWEHPLTIDRREVLRYLGAARADDPRLDEQVDDGIALCLDAVAPRVVGREYALGEQDGQVFLPALGLTLPGDDIKRHLDGSVRCVILASTVGAQVERLIAQLQQSALTMALIVDCAATAAVENLCDQYCAQLAAAHAADGLFVTDRFSCGYGDLPLTLQRPFVDAVDGGRQIGLYVTDTSLLTPRKSVTAIVGFVDREPSRRRSCDNCPMQGNCEFTKSCPYGS